MTADPEDRLATAAEIRALHEAGVLSREAEARALLLIEGSPSGTEWRGFLSWFLTAAGTALALAGVIFFFAYNWEALGRFLKLGLIELAIVALISGAVAAGKRVVLSQALLIAASVLVGPLLAVYGQTYQTGADAYELFVAWALLITPWVILARSAGLWVVFLALINTAFFLFWGQILDGAYDAFESVPPWLVLFAINVAAWAAWETLARRGVTWLRGRFGPRLLATYTCALLVVCLILLVIGEAEDTLFFGPFAIVLGVGLVAGMIAVYRGPLPDLFMLAVAAAASITVLTTLAGDPILDDLQEGGLILLGLLVLAQVGLAVLGIRAAARIVRSRTLAGRTGQADGAGT